MASRAIEETAGAGRGADANVAVRFTTSRIAGGAAEVDAYGTAVALEPPA